MYRRIALGLSVALLMSPVFAAADTATDSSQLISLYTQLIAILQKELAVIKNPAAPSITLSTSYGAAPLTVVFVLHDPTGTEAIDFGDGHSTGSNGCKKNSLGLCDLSQAPLHVYQFPGNYAVTLFTHGQSAVVQATTTVTVVQSIQ